MADIGNDFYVVKFSNMDDLSYVLLQGPWLIGDSYLTSQRWRLNFIAEEEKLRFIVAWIRIPNSSMEFFDSGVLTMVGKHVGRVLKIDKTTTIGERGRMIGRIWRIQYEGFRMICFNCGKIGHELASCAVHSATLTEEDPVDLRTKWNAEHPEYGEKYGRWMIPEPIFKKTPASWFEKPRQVKSPEGVGGGDTPPAIEAGDGFSVQGGKRLTKQVPTSRANSGTKNKETTGITKESGSRFSCLANLETRVFQFG
ncbi:hypothetical protein V2J09_001533 [Rumex salicifolius]